MTTYPSPSIRLGTRIFKTMARCRTRQLKFLVAIALFVFLFFVFVRLLSGGLPEDDARPVAQHHQQQMVPQQPPAAKQDIAEGGPSTYSSSSLDKHPSHFTQLQLFPDWELLRSLKTHQLRLDKGITELWWYVRANTKQATDPAASKRIAASVFEQHVMLQAHASQVEATVERLLGGWKQAAASELAGLLERRLHHLQNPPDCSKAKKLVCNLAKTCGFGCQVHHLATCFAIAYGTQRTLVLQTAGWRYASEGWEAVFMPISETCRESPEGESVCVCVCVCVCVFVCVSVCLRVE